MKHFESLLNGNNPIVTLSYNHANGGFDLGNHIQLYTNYQNDNFEDDFPGFLFNIDDYHFKTFDIIRTLFPDVKELVMACPMFWTENLHYIKKETEIEGYKTFYCADGEYSEYVREDDFTYLFRTNIDPHKLNLSKIMDYTVLVDDSDDDYDLSDRYDENMQPRFTPQKKYYNLPKEEYKERKEKFKQYRLNKESIRNFDFYYMDMLQKPYCVGYDEETGIWIDDEDTDDTPQLTGLHINDVIYLSNQKLTKEEPPSPYKKYKISNNIFGTFCEEQ